MAFAPLVLTGTPEIESTDVSDQVMSIVFSGTRDSVNIPATFGTSPSFAAGNATYEVTINFLQDVDATAISEILFTELADATGTIDVGATVRAGAVSASNPKYTGTAVVTGWELGGEVNTVGTNSVTFPLTARPTKVTS